MKHRTKFIPDLDGKLLIVAAFDCHVANGIGQSTDSHAVGRTHVWQVLTFLVLRGTAA